MLFDTTLLQEPLLALWQTIAAYLPNVLGAIVVFCVGVLFAVIVQRVVVRVIALLHIDEVAQRLELTRMFAQIGVRLNIGMLFGWIVKWFLIIVSLIAATDILGWGEVTGYLKQVVLFIPNVIIAVIILLAGILLGNMVQRIVRTAVEAAGITSATMLAGLAKWAIVVFSFMAAFVQLQIAEDLIRTLFTGLVYMLALAGGLAFGLGGRDHASRILDKLKEEITAEQK